MADSVNWESGKEDGEARLVLRRNASNVDLITHLNVKLSDFSSVDISRVGDFDLDFQDLIVKRFTLELVLSELLCGRLYRGAVGLERLGDGSVSESEGRIRETKSKFEPRSDIFGVEPLVVD